VLLAVVTARVLPSTPARTSEPASGPSARSVLVALRGRGLQLVGVTTVVLTVGHYTAYTYITPILLESGVAQGTVSPVLLGYGLAGAVGLVLAGVFADARPSGSLRTAIAVTAAALGAVAVISGATVGTVVAILVWGVAFSAVPTLLNAAALRVSPVPDAAPAVVNAMFNVGIASGAWVGGQALVAGGTSSVTVVAAILVALALPLTLLRASRPVEPTDDRAGRPTPSVPPSLSSRS
jgi:predicted MFS family arabinose efflux permease